MTSSEQFGQISRRGLLKGAVAGVGLLSISALLEACGAGAPGPNRSTSPGASASVGVDTGKQVALLRVSLPGSLSCLYPGQESGILNYYVAAIATEGLVGVDSAGKLVPALASDFSRPDPKRYVYTLRQGAKFSDGSPVTVADVLHSIEMARDSKVSPSTASYWANLDKAAQTGANEVTLTTKSVDEAFGWLPSIADALWIMPKSYWQANSTRIGSAKAPLVGSGAYQVTSFAPDSHVELSRFDGWWGTAPKVAKIRFDFVSDDNTRLLAWQAHDADMSLNVPLAQANSWAGAANTRVVYEPDRSYVGLTFNLKAKPFDDVHVRKAIAHAIDRTSLVTDLLHGRAQVATALSTPEQFGGLWSPAEATQRLGAVPQYAFDIAQAKAELAKSSVPHGFSVDLSYPSTGSQLGTAALAFAATLKQIGITLNVKELAIEQWLADLGKSPALSYMWYFNTTGDPGELPKWFLQAGNPANYANASVAATMVKAVAEPDPATRASLLIDAQAAEAGDLAYLPLWWGQAATAFSDHIGVKDFSSYTLLTDWPTSLYAAQ